MESSFAKAWRDGKSRRLRTFRPRIACRLILLASIILPPVTSFAGEPFLQDSSSSPAIRLQAIPQPQDAVKPGIVKRPPAEKTLPPITLEPRTDRAAFEPAGSTIDAESRAIGDNSGDSEFRPIPSALSGVVPSSIPAATDSASLQQRPAAAGSNTYKPEPESGSILVETSQDDDEDATATPGKKDTVWPLPEELLEEVTRADSFGPASIWSGSTVQTLNQFANLQSLDDPYIESLLSQLANQINELELMIVTSSTVTVQTSDLAAGPMAEQLRTLRQRLIQYWSISGSVYRVAVLSPGVIRRKQSLVPIVRVSSGHLQLPDLEPEWATYLTLEELQKRLDEKPTDVEARRNASQKFLSRLTSPVLTSGQSDYLKSRIEQDTVDAIREFAFEPVDLRETLEHVDAFVRTGHGYYSAKLASVMQGLAWQDDEPSQLLAQTLDQQLRGANLRISVSDEMLNRLLPETPDITEPVNENVMGADVRGQSRIANRLQIRLIPDSDQIQLRLESFGLVRSRTKAVQQGFEIDNVGDSSFQVFKNLKIGRHGILADRPAAAASASSKVVGMSSKYDSMPIVGHIARRLASRQIAEKTPATNRMVERRLESMASERFEQEIDAHLFDLQDYLTQNLVEPLTALELEPTPIEMRSTDDRIIMQYRMAGRDQLTASSSRPMGLQKSLMSMQVHESLINNMLARIDLAGQTFSGEELSNHFGEIFGFQAQPDPRFSEADYQLQFAAYDPVALHFDSDKVVIELNIRGFKVGRGKTWRNLTVRATYHPQVNGERLKLIQSESGISLKGSRLGARDQAALRVIFSAMFRGEYEVALLPDGITQRLGTPVAISQFELNEGWLAMSIDDLAGPAAIIPRNERPQGHHSRLTDQEMPRR